MIRMSSLLRLAVLSILVGGCVSQSTAPVERLSAAPGGAQLQKGGRAGPTGTIYVTSQGLYYDTFATADPLPMHGEFQLLVNGETEFGPGDAGYLGGRWWEDTNGNTIQDADDHFFLCPLLGPGRTTP